LRKTPTSAGTKGCVEKKKKLKNQEKKREKFRKKERGTEELKETERPPGPISAEGGRLGEKKKGGELEGKKGTMGETLRGDALS